LKKKKKKKKQFYTQIYANMAVDDENNPSTNDQSKISSNSDKDESSSSVKIDMRETLTTPHNDPSNPFALTPDQLAALQDPKNIELLHTYGGLDGVARGLHANTREGLSPNSTINTNITLSEIASDINQIKGGNGTATQHIEHVEPSSAFSKRAQVFGSNVLPEVKGNSLFKLMWMAFNDKTLVC
jgi:Ca2+-transporting ATPase